MTQQDKAAPELFKIEYTTLAFQWDGILSLNDPNDKNIPLWIRKHIENNKVSSTSDKKQQVINLGNKRGNYQALPGDWIAEDQFGHLFVISKSTFYERATELNKHPKQG